MPHNLFALPYPKLKLAILGLLALDVFIYAAVDTLTSTLDALAWVALLIMYELEATRSRWPFTGKTKLVIRNTLIVLIILMFFSYIRAKEWLDVINSMLWFVLIALLEVEIRWPEKLLEYQSWFWLLTMAVFIGLVGMVGAWLWSSAWLDAYDAALWIAAFALIEVDIFRFLKIKPARESAEKSD